MGEKTLFVVNPVAGKGRGLSYLRKIKSFLKDNSFKADIFISSHSGNIKSELENFYLNYKNIVAVGGDGTINEIVNATDDLTKYSLSIIPVGSGNDFWKNIDKDFNLSSFLKSLFNSKTLKKSVDVGNLSVLNRQKDTSSIRFINSVGVGLDSMVAHYHQNHSNISGVLSYLIALFKALKNYNAIEVNVSTNNKTITGKKTLITVANGVSSGGGFYLTPKAKVYDSLLDLSIIDQVSLGLLLKKLPLALFNKLSVEIPQIFYEQTNRVSISLFKPFFVHADGEIVTKDATELKFELLKNKLEIKY